MKDIHEMTIDELVADRAEIRQEIDAIRTRDDSPSACQGQRLCLSAIAAELEHRFSQVEQATINSYLAG